MLQECLYLLYGGVANEALGEDTAKLIKWKGDWEWDWTAELMIYNGLIYDWGV